MRHLVMLPVHNEERDLAGVLDRILVLREEVAFDVLAVDDGSTDGTCRVLRPYARRGALDVVRHRVNRGYGATLRTGFHYGLDRQYDTVTTIDSDGQHDPTLLPRFFAAARHADIVSGSRYLEEFDLNTPAPADRRRINRLVTDELNACFELGLTDAFCGFKAYRTDALARLDITEDGYGMPLELWVQAATLGLRIVELAVPLIYLDPNRSFGETLDDSCERLRYYQRVIDEAMTQAVRRPDRRLASGRGPVVSADC